MAGDAKRSVLFYCTNYSTTTHYLPFTPTPGDKERYTPPEGLSFHTLRGEPWD